MARILDTYNILCVCVCVCVCVWVSERGKKKDDKWGGVKIVHFVDRSFQFWDLIKLTEIIRLKQRRYEIHIQGILLFPYQRLRVEEPGCPSNKILYVT